MLPCTSELNNNYYVQLLMSHSQKVSFIKAFCTRFYLKISRMNVMIKPQKMNHHINLLLYCISM